MTNEQAHSNALQREKIIDDIELERLRQVSKGFDADHDDEHVGGELARAGGSYALQASGLTDPYFPRRTDGVPRAWPFDGQDWRPAPRDQKRRDLVRAAALLVAEIERLDRAASKNR